MAKKEAEAKADKKSSKKGRGKKGAAAEEPTYSSIATHPRARAAVRRTKGWFGLGGFALAAALSLKANVPLYQSGIRALVAGVAGYLVAWWFSMIVWRQLMLAEQRAALEIIERRRAERANSEPAETT